MEGFGRRSPELNRHAGHMWWVAAGTGQAAGLESQQDKKAGAREAEEPHETYRRAAGDVL